MIDKLSWIAVFPEIVLLVMACTILLMDLGVKTPQRTLTHVLTLLTLAAVAALEAAYALGGDTFYGFSKMVVVDPMGGWLKCFASIALMAALVYGRPYVADRDMLRGGEFFTLSLFALLGCHGGRCVQQPRDPGKDPRERRLRGLAGHVRRSEPLP